MSWHSIIWVSALVVLGIEMLALQPWLVRAIVRIAARVDAHDRNEAEDIYAEHMAGINALPGRIWRLVTACGLLFKVAIARRVHDGGLAAWCAVHMRIGLVRTAIARWRAAHSASTPAPGPKTTLELESPASHLASVDLVLLCGVVAAAQAIRTTTTTEPSARNNHNPDDDLPTELA
jgi:hypothetical protein